MRRVPQDALEEWCAHPITEALADVLKTTVERVEMRWLAMLDGTVTPEEHAAMRARRQILQEIRQLIESQEATKFEEILNDG